MRKRVVLCLALACVGWSVLVGAEDGKPAVEKQVLFVCTGNYYRSRFAEAVFNQKAKAAHLGWKAFSRGLRVEPGRGGISPVSRQELDKRGVPAELYQGDPQSLTQEDLNRADYVVVMDETEHRPMMEAQYLTRDDPRIHYWHVADTARLKPAAAIAAMSQNVEMLIRELTASQTK